MLVTKIERQARHPERLNVHLDGRYAFGAHREDLAAFNVKTGNRLDETTVEALLSREELNLAKAQALRYLTHRLRSENELRAKLIEKEYQPGTIDAVITYLHGIGLINDLVFARALVHDLQLRKPSGRRLLHLKLRSKGIVPSIIETVLNEYSQACDEYGLAMDEAKRVLRRYQSSRKAVDEQKQQLRVAQRLARRGFSWGIIVPVVRQLFSARTFP